MNFIRMKNSIFNLSHVVSINLCEVMEFNEMKYCITVTMIRDNKYNFYFNYEIDAQIRFDEIVKCFSDSIN